MDKLQNRLHSDFLQQSVVTLRRTESGYSIELKLPEFLSPHSQIWTQSLDKLPEPLTWRLSLLQKLQQGQPVIASKSLKRDLGTHKEFVESAVHNLSFDIFASRFTNSSLLQTVRGMWNCCRPLRWIPRSKGATR